MLNLIIHSLKSKKNWFILNFVITIIITIIMPTLFKDNYQFFSSFTMFLTAGLILVSNFKELSFLHDDRKISYYLSKPISMMSKINIALISNAIFTTLVFLLTFAISSLAGAIFSANDPVNAIEGFRYFEYVHDSLAFVKTMYAWILTLGFIITISSVLTGNDTISVFVTIFNYALPAIVYLVIIFICNILDNTIVGLSAELMVQSFVVKLLPLDKIYFADYIYDKAIDIFYFVRLALYSGIVYILTVFSVKSRKNERTGDYIVHKGYKYFISIFASLLLPVFVTSNMGSYDLLTIVAVLVLLSSLSYYILISVLDRSFRITKQALQIYIPFIIIFIASIFIGSGIMKARTAFIPELTDVKAVYIGSNSNYLRDAEYLKKTEHKWESLIKANYDKVKDNNSIIILKEKDSIEKVIKLQKSMMQEKDDNYSYRNIHIIYYLNNGKKIVRSYNIPYDYEEENLSLELSELIRTEEFIQKRFRVFCDEDYINNVKFSNVYIYSKNEQYNVKDFNYNSFALAYMEDFRNFIKNNKNINLIQANILLDLNSFDFISKTNNDKEYIDKNLYYEDTTINFEPSIEDGISVQYVTLPKAFTKTTTYIESLKKDNN